MARCGLLVVTLFVLGRAPVLFMRQRLVDEIGGPIAPIWQDDALIRTVFLFSALAVSALAIRCFDGQQAWRHALLAMLLGLAVVSTAWSVEPSVTQLRALMFLTTAGVGWYIGRHLSLPEQLDVVIGAGALGVGASLVALVWWPDLARATNGVAGRWSGVYVNRNLLALVLCTTLLAALLRFPSARAIHRVGLATLAVVALWLLWESGARTGPVALMAAVAAVVLALVVRRLLVDRGAPNLLSAGALLAGALAGLLLLDVAQGEVFDLLGREPTFTRRTDMWDIDRMLLEVRPWRGWGFEAIWAHQPAIDFAAPLFHAYPYQAHSGYFEMALSLGRVGLFLLLALIVVTFVRTVGLAWEQSTAVALWPLAITTFAVVANLSEGLFVANEVLWALFVSAGVAAVVARRADGLSPAPVGEGSPGSPAAPSLPSGPT